MLTPPRARRSDTRLPTTSIVRSEAEFRRFEEADAERLPAYYDALEAVADVRRDLALETPPNLGGSSLPRRVRLRGPAPPRDHGGGRDSRRHRKSTLLNSSH